jgi:hypothetical protein
MSLSHYIARISRSEHGTLQTSVGVVTIALLLRKWISQTSDVVPLPGSFLSQQSYLTILFCVFDRGLGQYTLHDGPENATKTTKKEMKV